MLESLVNTSNLQSLESRYSGRHGVVSVTVGWTGGVGGPRRRDALSRDPGNAVGSGPRVQSLTICQRSRYPRQLQC